MIEFLTSAARAAGFLVISVGLCWTGKKARELVPQWRRPPGCGPAGSEACAISEGSYYIGAMLSLGGPVSWASPSVSQGFAEALLFGLLAVLLLNASVLIAERTYLARWKLPEGVAEGDRGAALAEGAHYIALGLMIMGASWGDSGGPAVMLFFWLLGQAFLGLGVTAYGKLFRIDPAGQLAARNLPAALSLAGAVIAFGNASRAAISGPFLGCGRSTLDAAGFFIFAFAALLGARHLADLWLFPNATFNREIFQAKEPSRSAAVLDASLFIGVSILLGWAIS